MNRHNILPTTIRRIALTAVIMFGLICFARADPIPPGWTAENMEVVGYTIMNDHPAFKLTMTRAGDRWYLIGAHYNVPGWSVIAWKTCSSIRAATFT
jgi:hypothetical protein